MRIRRLAAGAFLLLGVVALLPGLGHVGGTGEPTYGVSRADGEPGIAIHWVLCDGVAPRSVDLEGYWGGSQLPTAVPVLWQIRSDLAPAAGIRVERYEVGQTPAGFYETVPLQRELPHDRIAISAPPGDGTSLNGMSFYAGELRPDAIYRGDYTFVSPDQFARDGAAYCANNAGSPQSGIALASLGIGGLLLTGRRRPILALIAALFVLGGAASLVGPQFGLPGIGSIRQPSSAFSAGTTTVGDRKVLADLSPQITRSDGGLFVARFVAPGDYAFAVSCDGASLQIGEASEIENGGTGGRQLVGCATGNLVKGAIADSGERGDLVEVVVNPNGITDWRVLVVAGSGQVGPFDEP
jgi:hypothetical protein